MSVEIVALALWREPHAISIFDVGGSAESGEEYDV